MTRLWTLQEAVCAGFGRLWFLFEKHSLSGGIQHQLVNGDQAYFSLGSVPWSRHLGNIAYSTLRAYVDLRPQWILDEDDEIDWADPIVEAASFGTILSSLRCRFTSVPSDEALCLSTLSRLDVRELSSVPVASRMEWFWRRVQRVPCSLLMWQTPCLNTVGLRWAPRSLLGFRDNTLSGSDTYSHMSIFGEVTSKGLLFTARGFIFTCGRDELYFPLPFLLQSSMDDRAYRLQMSFNNVVEDVVFNTQQGSNNEELCMASVTTMVELVRSKVETWEKPDVNLAVIWLLTPSPDFPLGRHDDYSVLIMVKKMIDGTIYGEKICGTYMRASKVRAPPGAGTDLPLEKRIIIGEETNEGQLWCID